MKSFLHLNLKTVSSSVLNKCRGWSGSIIYIAIYPSHSVFGSHQLMEESTQFVD